MIHLYAEFVLQRVPPTIITLTFAYRRIAYFAYF